MSFNKFYPIIDLESVRVCLPNDSHFSLGTSPYYAHQHGLAIDIYPKLTLDSYDIMSPVSGIVLEIKKMRAPRPRFKGALDVEYLILIRNDLNEDLVFKILHVKPQVKLEERIEIGDILGSTFRSGYFAPWSSTHLHLEIRNKDDAIRASGGRNFALNLKKDIIGEKTKKEESNNSKIPIKIKNILPEYLLVHLPGNFYHYIAPIFGVRGILNNNPCIIDCGIPQYKNGIIITEEPINENLNANITLNGSEIGILNGNFKELGFFKFKQVRITLNGKEIRGISLYLSNKMPLLKLIPYKRNDFPLNLEKPHYLRIREF